MCDVLVDLSIPVRVVFHVRFPSETHAAMSSEDLSRCALDAAREELRLAEPGYEGLNLNALDIAHVIYMGEDPTVEQFHNVLGNY